MYKQFDLIPNDGRKSFYHKAVVTEANGAAVLRSYNTEVCEIDAAGVFHRYWSGYSVTTMRHVNAFLDLYGVPGGGKAWWDAQPVERRNVARAVFDLLHEYENITA